MRVLPADVYDALELSALVFGGIGGPDIWERDGRHKVVGPLCLYGHAAWLCGQEVAFVASNPIADALDEAGFGGGISDRACLALAAYNERVPFEKWSKRVRLVRGK